MKARLLFCPPWLERFSTSSLSSKVHLPNSSSLLRRRLTVVPLGRGREYTHYLSQWLRGVKHCVTHPETRNFGEKLQNPEQHWHAPPLCTKQPVRGGFERKRLRWKCCKRQCWPLKKNIATQRRILLLSYNLRSLKCAYEPYFPTIKPIARKWGIPTWKQNIHVLIKSFVTGL